MLTDVSGQASCAIFDGQDPNYTAAEARNVAQGSEFMRMRMMSLWPVQPTMLQHITDCLTRQQMF